MKLRDLLYVIPKQQDFEVTSKMGHEIVSYSWFYSPTDTYQWILDKLGDKTVCNISTTYDDDILIIKIN